MLRDLHADALRRLREHGSLLDRIAEALLERETLDGGELAVLIGLRLCWTQALCDSFSRKLCGKMESNEGNQTIYGSKEEGDTEEGRSTRQGEGETAGQELRKEVPEAPQAKGQQEEGRKTSGAPGSAQAGHEAGFAEVQRQGEHRSRLQRRVARDVGQTAGDALISQLRRRASRRALRCPSRRLPTA